MIADSEKMPSEEVPHVDLKDPVDEMVDESFPASDPPSGWAGEDPRDADPTVDVDKVPPT